MAFIDWAIVILYVLIALAIGVYFTRKAAHSLADFFVAGRSLGWFVAGTSIVATSFSADTPLMVSGICRRTGIYDNWFWWAAAAGNLASVFFFARLWRRSEILTEVEFVARRYPDGPAASALRVFKVIFSLIVNCIVMASITLAMGKILKALMNLSDAPLTTLPLIGEVTPTMAVIAVLGVTAVVYSTLSGLYGVVYTDLIQFALAMIGSITLAVVVYVRASDGEGLLHKFQRLPGMDSTCLNFFPDLSALDLITFTFIAYFVLALNAAAGSGIIVQRLLATRSESDSFFASLWFVIAHYVLRPWPWIIVGVLSLHYLPQLEDPEIAFPHMINLFLPAGIKGVMVASLLAAFMSTVDTHLNWGASYIVNDLYKPFIAPHASQRNYVSASRISMIVLTVVAVLITARLSSILGVYKYLAVISGGIGTVAIARWYWWRVNAFSEIAAIIASLVIGNLMVWRLPDTETQDLWAVRALVTAGAATVVWVVATLLTARQPDEKTEEFHRTMRIGGAGWRRVAEVTGVAPHAHELRRGVMGWLVSVAAVYAALLGLGYLVFQRWLAAGACLSVAVASGALLAAVIGRWEGR